MYRACDQAYNCTVVNANRDTMWCMTARDAFPKPAPPALVELVAQRFRVMGEPMRIRLLDTLRDGPATVSELTDALGASQQNVSKHLAILASAGLVAREKDG